MLRTVSCSLFLILSLAGSLPAAESQPVPIDHLAWLTGHWSGEKDGVVSEEIWTSTAGGWIVGLHKDVKGDRMVSFEFLRIGPVEPGGALAYFASPRGQQPTTFRMVEQTAKRVVFADPTHDFPQRILYWLAEDGALYARVEGTIQGKLESEEWRWTRR
jgi:hypothetical protein